MEPTRWVRNLVLDVIIEEFRENSLSKEKWVCLCWFPYTVNGNIRGENGNGLHLKCAENVTGTISAIKQKIQQIFKTTLNRDPSHKLATKIIIKSKNVKILTVSER